MLTREQFRKEVFARDYGMCIVPGCGAEAVDAHHIMERDLWKEPEEMEGYFLDNGASLCSRHHWHAEKNFFPPQACRNWAGITTRHLPQSLDYDCETWYNKWGIEIPIPPREGKIKYPSTMYLPFSPSIDSKVTERGLIDTADLLEKPLVVTLKMDGSNAMLTKSSVAARNGDNAPHPSFSMLKALHAEIKYRIPDDLQIFGEWLHAKHSIHYKGSQSLRSFFQVFAAYRPSEQLWLSWEGVVNTVEDIADSRVTVVPLVGTIHGADKEYKLIADLSYIAEHHIASGHEGIVVRSAYPFHYGQFKNNVAKYVRKDHVQTDKHWSLQQIIPNEVRS